MVRSLLYSAAALALALQVNAQENRIDTPSAIYQCTAAKFTITCASPPCTLVARPSGDATSSVHNFDKIDSASGSASWTVDQPAGSSVTLWITDSTGSTISSSALTVAEGDDDSCLDGSSSSSGSSASSAASSAASGASSAASSAKSGASSAASSAKSAASSAGASASESADAAAASASADADGSAAGVFVKGSVLGAALLAASAALF
ncbi:hypothetical protein JCM8547_003106 [Rhodosporidiobolus lusitaniae]